MSNVFKEYVLSTLESRANFQKVIYQRAFILQESILKAQILLKKAQLDENLSLQINNKLDFIKQAQDELGKENHNIRLFEYEEFKEKIMDLKYWIKLVVGNQKRIEELYLK